MVTNRNLSSAIENFKPVSCVSRAWNNYL